MATIWWCFRLWGSYLRAVSDQQSTVAWRYEEGERGVTSLVPRHLSEKLRGVWQRLTIQAISAARETHYLCCGNVTMAYHSWSEDGLMYLSQKWKLPQPPLASAKTFYLITYQLTWYNWTLQFDWCTCMNKTMYGHIARPRFDFFESGLSQD